MKLFFLALKNLRRNLVRTGLTSVATMVLVFVITLIWSILWFLNAVTAEKSKDFKAIISERWQIPSQMPFAYARDLSEGSYDPSRPDSVRPLDYMTWGFYGGTLDPTKKTRENQLFLFVMEPEKVMSMMDELDQIDPSSAAGRQIVEGIQKMKDNKRGAVIGSETLKLLNKRVGDRLVVTSMNYKNIDLEFDIVGTFPDGRYNKSAVMNRVYLNDALDDYKRKNGAAHPMADRSLALVWLRVNDPEAYRQVAQQITTSSKFTSPSVKVETASNGIASFLDAYKDILAGMRFLLVPAIAVTMCLVIANAISISVRERRTEIAVMKVLGFRPGQVLLMILGEALLVGTLSGLLSAGATYYYVDFIKGGLNFQIAFFGKFFIPDDALWWGPLLGGGTAFLGSFFPAWSACSVKVTEVFSKVG